MGSDAAPSTSRSGVVDRVRGPAAALTAQFSQAAVSFGIQLVAVRTLTLADYGFFAIAIGIIVLATAITTGFVGDPLTVLDRHDPPVRRALQLTAGWLVAAAGALTLLSALVVFGRDPATAILFALALTSFVVEDLVRRWLMATRRFWRVVLVDLSYGLVVIAVFAVSLARAGGLASPRLELTDLFVAVTVGQVVATVLGLLLVPRGERWWARGPDAALREVARLGFWRAAQSAVRPGTLAGVRWLILVVLGAAAVGVLEANRVLVAPALLAVQGLGSYLLVQMSEHRRGGGEADVARADRAAVLLASGTTVLAVLLALATPLLGPLLLGPDVPADPWLVLGWGTMAIGVAWTMPYTSLAAVHGKAHRVVWIRLGDASVSLVLVAVLLGVGGNVVWVPYLLGAAALAGAAVQRWSLTR